jgi:DNA-binding NarL/FixJ family response regulator
MDNQEQGRKPGAQKVRVLIVDPHACFRSASKALLQTEGLAVVADLDRCDSAEDVTTALRPDVVLIAISPQKTEGLTLARRLSTLPQRPAIVLMSANQSDAILASWSGADLFLVKAGISARAIAQAAREPRSQLIRRPQ